MISFRNINLVKNSAFERIDLARQFNLSINTASSCALILGSRKEVQEFALGLSSFAYLEEYVLSGQYIVDDVDIANPLTLKNRSEVDARVHVIEPELLSVFTRSSTLKSVLNFLIKQRGGSLPDSIVDDIRFVQLDETVLNQRMETLSVSQKVKSLLLVAILTGARLLVFEELEIHLDDVELDECLSIVRQFQINSGASCIFLTTDFMWGIEECDSIAILQAGVVLESGSCTEIERKALHPSTLEMQRGKYAMGFAPMGCPYSLECKAKSRVSEQLCATTLPICVSITDTHVVRCHLSAEERTAHYNEVSHDNP